MVVLDLQGAARRSVVTLASAGLLMGLAAGPLASRALAATDQCVSTNGTVRVQQGTATCSSVTGAGNVAIARGAEASATAGLTPGDTHDKSTASGTDSAAVTGGGSGNTATASGAGSDAQAEFGNGNTATASGTSSNAQAGNGNGNTATASSPGCTATATGSGTTSSC